VLFYFYEADYVITSVTTLNQENNLFGPMKPNDFNTYFVDIRGHSSAHGFFYYLTSDNDILCHHESINKKSTYSGIISLTMYI
jgi:hypothetical protein